ncbi:MAG TPA: GNAT family N-acetyltransferase [Thermosynechococcaceae cyanobacterium]
MHRKPRADIRVIGDLTRSDLSHLLKASQEEGFRSIRRLIDDWESGLNRFDHPGEILLSAYDGRALIGVCGLNCDPYEPSGRVSRVRRSYVLSQYRRQGVGSALLNRIVAEARLGFDRLHVRTDHVIGDRFFCALGFIPSPDSENYTHWFGLREGQE